MAKHPPAGVSGSFPWAFRVILRVPAGVLGGSAGVCRLPPMFIVLFRVGFRRVKVGARRLDPAAADRRHVVLVREGHEAPVAARAQARHQVYPPWGVRRYDGPRNLELWRSVWVDYGSFGPLSMDFARHPSPILCFSALTTTHDGSVALLGTEFEHFA